MLRESPLPENQQKILQPWLTGWAMPNLLTVSEYKQMLKKAGFKEIKIFNLTDNMKPSLSRLELITKIGLPISTILFKMKIFSKERFGNVQGSVYQMKALKLGLWSYIVITGKK